ncbi:MAG TPA: VWA domain-containing protein [Stenotrophomonas sp.]|nr:VWA domain-containing protein [Stenotrophomonas sp.]
MSSLDTWLQAFAGSAWPWAWWLLPLPLLVLLLPPLASRAAALRVPYASALQGIAAEVARRPAWRRVPWLLWLAWLCLCAALSRPQELGAPVTPPQQARQMMLAVDLSASMTETDMQLGGQVVDRLTAAKAVLADFLDRRQGDRVGLLVFAERAYALTPLTADLPTVRDQLRDAVVGLAGRQTAIGDALALSVKRLREQPLGQRVVILLTDGESNAGSITPEKAAELAAATGVRVHTIAFGGAGGYSVFGIPLPGGGDEIDETTLRQIAEKTGGRFFRARDADELAGIYAELDRLEPVAAPGVAVRPRIERYAGPLAIALLLVLLHFAWPWRPR